MYHNIYATQWQALLQNMFPSLQTNLLKIIDDMHSKSMPCHKDLQKVAYSRPVTACEPRCTCPVLIMARQDTAFCSTLQVTVLTTAPASLPRYAQAPVPTECGSPQGLGVPDEHSHPLWWYNNAVTPALWALRLLQPAFLCGE